MKNSNLLRNKIGKKALASICAFTILVSALPAVTSIVSTDASAATVSIAVTKDYLNVRSGPGTSYSVISVLAENTEVTVLDNSGNGWTKIKTPNGVVGYCSNDYLISYINTSNSVIATAETTDYLNVRSGAGTTYKIISVLNKGTKVDIIDNSNSLWAKVKLSDGTTGYCSKSYLKIIQNSNSNVIDTYKKVTTTITAKSTDYLNIRTGAGTSYSIVTTVSPNTVMTVTDNSNSKWAKVKLSNGTTGYCSKDYLTITTKSVTTYTPLKEGNTGEAVKKLQTRLSELQYYNGSIDGVYDSDVTLAVKKFQITNMLELKDGSADSTTLSNLYSSSALIATTKISLSSSSISLSVGESYTLKATTTPSGRALIYKTSDSSVATVSNQGVIKGISYGKATITVTDITGTVVSKCTVNVGNDELVMKDISLSTDTLLLYVGDTYTLTADTVPANCQVYWTLSRDNVVTVDNGKITVIGTGKVSVRAQNKDGTVIDRCIITAMEKPEITLSESNVSLKKGSEYQLSVNVTPTNTKLIYSSSNEAVATVKNGKIKAIGDGTAIITVKDSTGTVSKQCTVTVGNKSITLNRTSATINKGSSVTLTAQTTGSFNDVIWTSSDTSVAYVKDGVVSGISAGTAIITAKDKEGDVKATCKITVNNVASSSRISLSNKTGNLTVGKTLYVSAVSTSALTWSSSDNSIAMVDNGFITAVSEGTAVITAEDKSGNVSFCTITVSPAEPVKYIYTSPNSALTGEDITLVAITDKLRTDVRFIVNINGNETVVSALSKKSEGNTYVWTATINVDKIGEFNVTAESFYNSEWNSCNDGKTTIFVTSSENRNNALVRELRASDEVLSMIADFEGFLPTVKPDTLAYNIPNIGHGHVIWSGDIFYNGITEREAYACLVKSINEGAYTKQVNKFLINNNIKFRQQHFDALMCFSYNVGTGWTSNSDVKTYLLNSLDPNDNSGSVYKAKVTSSNGLNVRSGAGTSYRVIDVLNYNDVVTLVDKNLYNNVWYKVKLSDGTIGYCSSTYLSVTSSTSTVRNCDYINKKAFTTELLSWHHAAGVCYYGLLYRRADELEMFFYNDYTWDGRKNKYSFPDTYCLNWP